MSGVILLPQRFLTQPQYDAPINPEWLKRGLVIACNPAVGAFNQVTRQHVTNSGGLTTTPTGSGKSWNGGASKYIDFGSGFDPGTAGCTVLQVVNPGSASSVFSFSNRAGSSSAGIEILIGNGGVPGLARFRMHNPEVSTGDLTGLNDGKDHVLIARFTPSTEIKIWADSLSKSSANTTSIPASTTSTQNLRLHSRSTTWYPSKSGLFLLFNNPRPEDDCGELFENPYSYCQAPPIRIYISIGADASITGAGQIASAEAVGQPALSIDIAAAGIATAEAVGSPGVAANVAATGIASAEADGSPAVAATVTGAGIASAEAFGSPAIAATIEAAGIAGAEAVGAPIVGGVAAAEITAAGITSAEAIGSPALGVVVAAAGIASAEALGQPNVGAAAAAITGVGQIATAEAIGAPAVGIAVSGAGVSSAEAFGNPALAVQVTGAGGIASAAAVGAPLIGELVAAEITGVGGIASSAAVGSPTVFPLTPYTGTGFQLGSGHRPMRSRRNATQLAQHIQPHRIAAVGIESQERFGYPKLEWGGRSRKIRDEEFLLGRAA